MMDSETTNALHMVISRLNQIESRIIEAETLTIHGAGMGIVGGEVPERVDCDTRMASVTSWSLEHSGTSNEVYVYGIKTPTLVSIDSWDQLKGGAGQHNVMLRHVDTQAVYYGNFAITDPDVYVKVTGADSTANYLYDKVAGGLYVDLSVLNAGGDEDLYIEVDRDALQIPSTIYGLLPGVNADIIYNDAGTWKAAQAMDFAEWAGLTVNVFAPIAEGGAVHSLTVIGVDNGEAP